MQKFEKSNIYTTKAGWSKQNNILIDRFHYDRESSKFIFELFFTLSNVNVKGLNQNLKNGFIIYDENL